MKCSFIIWLLLATLAFPMVVSFLRREGVTTRLNEANITFSYFKVSEFHYGPDEYTPRPEVIHTKHITHCDPPAGDHPMKEDICVKLTNLSGDMEKLADKDVECPKASDLKDQHSAWADGVFKGWKLYFSEPYDTKCELKKANQGIFDFE